MSNYLEYCRAYIVQVYEKKSGRYYRFSVVAEDKPHAIRLVQKYSAEAIGDTCEIRWAKKLPNKPQVIDFSEG